MQNNFSLLVHLRVLSFSFVRSCDHCLKYFHGKCVGVDESTGKLIKKYICPFCRGKKAYYCINAQHTTRALVHKTNTINGKLDLNDNFHRILDTDWLWCLVAIGSYH